MTPREADELYELVIDLFPPVSPERAFRLRAKFIESALAPDVLRELLHQHRDTHENMTEPNLLAALAKEAGVPALADPAKVAAEKLREQREAEQGRWRSGCELDRHRLDELGALPSRVLAELREQALAGLQSDMLRERLAQIANPLSSPTLSGLMLQAWQGRNRPSVPAPVNMRIAGN